MSKCKIGVLKMLRKVKCFTVPTNHLGIKDSDNYIVKPGDIVYYDKFLLVKSNPIHGHIFETKYNYELEVYEMCDEYTFCNSFTIYPSRHHVWVFTPHMKPYGSTVNGFVYKHYVFDKSTMSLHSPKLEQAYYENTGIYSIIYSLVNRVLLAFVI